MKKGLFTSMQEISFHYNYVQGNAPKALDPNIKRSPATMKRLGPKKLNQQILKARLGRSR
ncbi:MAG: hypothetical protein ACI4OR_02155 [Alphaproteobacteria bacterium]